MTIDGRSVTPIYGPYGGLYYSCMIGAWSAGTHTYVITTSNSAGFTANSSGTFTVVAATSMGGLKTPLGSQLEMALAGVKLGSAADQRADLLDSIMQEMGETRA